MTNREELHILMAAVEGPFWEWLTGHLEGRAEQAMQQLVPIDAEDAVGIAKIQARIFAYLDIATWPQQRIDRLQAELSAE